MQAQCRDQRGHAVNFIHPSRGRDFMLVASARIPQLRVKAWRQPHGYPGGHPGFIAKVQAGGRFDFAAYAGLKTRILTTSTRGASYSQRRDRPITGNASQHLTCRRIREQRGGVRCAVHHFLLAASIVTLLSLNACKVGPTDRGPAPSPAITRGPEPHAAQARQADHSHRAGRRGQGLAGRHEAHGAGRSHGERLRQRPRTSALGVHAAQWRRAGRRDQCAASVRRTARASRARS